MKKKITCVVLTCIMALFVTSLSVSAQTKNENDEYRTILKKILSISGTTASTDSLLPQLVTMIKKTSPITDEAALTEFMTVWQKKIENTVIDTYVPIYQRYLSMKELNKIVDFYESPVGKKLSKVALVLIGESFPMLQKLGSEMMTDMAKYKPFIEEKTVAVEKTEEREPFTRNGKTEQQMFAEAYTIPSDSIALSPIVYYRGMNTAPSLYSIERRKKDTKVTFSVPVYFDSQWLHFGKGFKIIDKASGDEYNVRGYDGGTPFGRLLILKGFNNKSVLVSLIFPKLKKNVKIVDILELPRDTDALPSNDDGVARAYLNVDMEKYTISTKKNKKEYN